MCKAKFPSCICRPIAAQFIGREKIALFSFEEGRGGEAKILNERHYMLVEPNQISKEDLENYRSSPTAPARSELSKLFPTIEELRVERDQGPAYDQHKRCGREYREYRWRVEHVLLEQQICDQGHDHTEHGAVNDIQH